MKKSNSKIDVNINLLTKATLNAVINTSGVIDETIVAELARERKNNKLIVVAATPKSGSTFLANTICQITNLRYFRLCSAYSTNEHDLYLPALCAINQHGCVTQMHMKGSFHNAALARAFAIKPIILVRGIDDTVASLCNDIRQKEARPGYGNGYDGYSFFWPDQNTRNLNDEQLIDMIIDLAVPWYVNFYVSWHRLCAQNAIEAIWVCYEDMMSNKETVIKEIITFLGYTNLDKIDTTILSQQYETYQGGETGKGKAVLSSKQKKRIRSHFSYYPDIDFSMYRI